MQELVTQNAGGVYGTVMLGVPNCMPKSAGPRGRLTWAMLRWMCGLKTDDSTSIGFNCAKLDIVDLNTAIHCA